MRDEEKAYYEEQKERRDEDNAPPIGLIPTVSFPQIFETTLCSLVLTKALSSVLFIARILYLVN